MLSLLPPQPRGADEPPVSLALDEAALLSVSDPWRRSRLADELAKQLTSLAGAVLRIRSDAIGELIHQHGAAHARVARHLGVSRARVGQLVAAASPRFSTTERGAA